jgi:hypothetical protein
MSTPPISTRTIVTSQPDVACYVCGRRLLRGELHDVFLIGDSPRTVCELCAPRAAHEGWPRESEAPLDRPPPARSGRGRGLFGRLRSAGRGARAQAQVAGEPTRADAQDPAPYDFLAGAPPAVAELAAEPASACEVAVRTFNASEFPRRVAGLARSLGRPDVSVREDRDLGVVVIVVAWELCWYRYQVELDAEQLPVVTAVAQGTELSQLARTERLPNASVDELGALALSAVQA